MVFDLISEYGIKEISEVNAAWEGEEWGGGGGGARFTG